jgi:hypothetical protein
MHTDMPHRQELIDVTQIVVLALLATMADGHVFQEALTQRGGGFRAHKEAPV